MATEYQNRKLESLSAVESTGAGTEFDLRSPHRTFGVQVTTTGSPATVDLNLEGSMNGDDWFVLGSWKISSGQSSGDIVFAVDKPVIQIRANLTALSGGTDPTVTATIAAAL